MKTLRLLVNLVCVLALILGLVISPQPAAAKENTALHILTGSRLARQSQSPVADVPAGLSAAEWAGVQAQIAAAEYAAAWQPETGAYRAANRGQGFEAAFSLAGFSVTTGEGEFGLTLTAYGGQALDAVQSQPLSADGGRVTAWRGPGVREWYENTPQGVKHGLTLYAPPVTTSVVTLSFAITGSLRAEMAPSGGLLLRAANNAAVLAYDGLAVYDLTGRSLPAGMALTEAGLRITIDDAGAVYPLTVDPLLHSQTHILRASNAQASDYFGYAVDLDGDTLVIGASSEDGITETLTNTGAAYIFQRNQDGADAWGEVAVLRASDAQANDAFGSAVAISGNTVIVGAPYEDGESDSALDSGSVYIFYQNQGGANAWGQVAVVRNPDWLPDAQFGSAVTLDGDVAAVAARNALGNTGVVYILYRNQGGADQWGMWTYVEDYEWDSDDHYGADLDLSGDTLVVGAYGEDGGTGNPLSESGAAFVYQRNEVAADIWGHVTTLRASDAQVNDYFGFSVSISGDTIVVGAALEDGGPGDPLSNAGAAYVFRRNQGGADLWGQVAILHASDAQVGDMFGASLGLDGDLLVVGAQNEGGGLGDPLTSSGAAYVFERSQGGIDAWGEINILRASDAQEYDYFGTPVAIDGNMIVAGAYTENGGSGDPLIDAGAVYLFSAGGTWQEAAEIRNTTANDYGLDAALDGDTLVVGAHHGGLSQAGEVYVYYRDQDGAGAWGQVAILSASNGEVGDDFGLSVAIAGDVIVVGADCERGASNEYTCSGAAYVFHRNQGGADAWGEVALLRGSDTGDVDQFGWDVAIDGDTLVVGSINAGVGGAAYVFQRNQGGADAWGEVAILQSSEAQIGDAFGDCLDISGDTIVVGAHYEDGGPGEPNSAAGAAYVFQRNLGGADSWNQVTILRASDPQAGDQFGVALAIFGDTIVVGANFEDGGLGNPLADTGAAYVYQRNQGGADQWGEVTILRASDAQAGDRFGESVDISGDMLVVGAISEDGGPGDPQANSGAAYVFERNQGGPGMGSVPDAWGQVRTLRVADTQLSHFMAVSIDGNTLVGSVPDWSSFGAATIFTLQAGWEPEALPQSSDAQSGDLFGSVALDGDTLVVGAPEADVCPITEPISDTGAAYVFIRQPGGWAQDAVLCAPDAQAGDRFGFSVAISGATIVVGAYGRDGDRGAAYVFEYTALQGINDWSQVGTLGVGSGQAGDGFGYSVAVQGAEIIVGAPWADGTQADEGAAYVFEDSPTLNAGLDDWSQVGTLGSANSQASGLYGFALGVAGDLLAVGAPGEDQPGTPPVTDAGVVYVYLFNPGVNALGAASAPEDWSQVGTLGAGVSAGQGDGFGHALAMLGNLLVVGAPFEDGLSDLITDSGAAYIFDLDFPLSSAPAPADGAGIEDWSQVGTLGAGASAGQGDRFGSSVGMNAQAILVSAPFEDGGPTDPLTDTGAAYVFSYNPLVSAQAGSQAVTAGWEMAQALRSPEGQAGDRFGDRVTLDGNTAAIGAPYEDGGVTDPLSDTGAAYVFELILPNAAPVLVADDLSVMQNSTANVLDVLSNDLDANGDTLQVFSVGEPVHGTAVDNDINVLYTPQAGYGGTDTFTYTVIDGSGGYAVGQVTVEVSVPPVADDLAFSTPEDVEHVDQLTATDVNGDVLSYILNTSPHHGSVDIAASGDFTYTPGLNYNGLDAFTFIASDGALTDIGRVDITITAVNDAPQAVGQDIVTPEEAAYTGFLGASDAEGDPLAYSLGAAPQHGSVSIAAGGAFTYTPGLNYNGSDVFTFTVSDGALTDIGRVDITVTAVNDAPLAFNQGIATTEDTPYTGLLGASDIEDDPLAYSLGAAPQHGSVSIAAGGTFTYTPGLDYNGLDAFAFIVSDGALTDTGQVDVTVISADAAATTLSLAADPEPSAVGQEVTFAAVVASAEGIPSGVLVFRDGPIALVTATLDVSGAASFSTAGLALGEHVMRADYLGGPDYQPSSFTLTHTVAYIADLGTSITATLTPGHVVYTIVVTNDGFNDADGAAVSVNFPSHLTQITWTCVAGGGATCTASGSGALQDVLASFPVGGMVTYTVNANRLELESMYTVVTATLPEGVIDLDPGDNQAHFPPGYRFLLPLVLRAQPQ
ncbi:MAG TPA: Ig-like domain-containing protein [Anaerolineales bacterium]|nr:Ig-like domain-containing protein [Anaerolineales bacterium]